MEESDRDDAAHLKSLRLAAGLDHAQLALMANLSAGQIRQLEDSGDSLFYSPQIKAQSLRRVIRLLETTPEESLSPASEPSAPRTSASVIDDIIRLSEKNLKSQVVHSEVRRPGANWPKLLGTWGLAVALLTLAGWQYNRHNNQGLYTEWVEPFTAKVLPAPQAPKTDEVALPIPEVIATEPATLKTETVTAPVLPPPAAATVEADLPAAKLAPPEAAPVASSAVAGVDCANIKTEPVNVSSVSPNKAGSYVYLVSSKTTTVCVDDGKNKRTLVTLTPGAGRSIHGSAPWTVASADMKHVQVFFQGAKVWLPPEAGLRIYLKEQPISP
jgi:hypothetical protein